MTQKNLQQSTLFVIIGIAIILFSIYSLFQLSSINVLVDTQSKIIEEAARPAQLDVITIESKECPDCTNLSLILDTLASGNVRITTEKHYTSGTEEANQLIADHSIIRLPAIILLGDVEKVNDNNFEIRNNALIFEAMQAPYVDAKTGTIQGLVAVTIIKDSTCLSCTNMDVLLDELKQFGVKISGVKTLEFGSDEAAKLIQTYSIQMIPTVVLSSEVKAYGPPLENQWSQIGSKEADGSFILRQLKPPFVNTTTAKKVGDVTLIILDDSTCEQCYDAKATNLPILQRLGLLPANITIVDINSAEGANLVKQYDLTAVPTILLSGDVYAYPAFVQAWKGVGSVEPDGMYVFRKPEVIQGTYKNILTGNIITPSADNTQ